MNLSLNCHSLLVFISALICFRHQCKAFDQFSTKIISLSAKTRHNLIVYDSNNNRPHNWIKFVTIGAHTQQHNITLTSSATDDRNRNQLSITGRNVGVVLFVDRNDGSVSVFNNNSLDISVMIVVNSYKDSDPIPGACNRDLQADNSPYLRLFANQYVNQIHYQMAAFDSNCDDSSRTQIKYRIYAHYLRRNDLTETEYFRAIKSMSNKTAIQLSSDEFSLSGVSPSMTRAIFYSYPGHGVIYNLMAISRNSTVVYIPVATYNCNDLGVCGNLDTLSIIVVCLFGVLGVAICLRGHQWFKLQVIFIGFIDGSFVTYFLLLKYVPLKSDELTIYSLLFGSIVSIIWLSMWKIAHNPLFTLLLTGCTLGFLCGATVLYSPVGNFDIFANNDLNYWLLIGAFTLGITFCLMLVSPVLLSITSSSIIGAYVFVLMIDRFINGSLFYIIFNVIKRAVFSAAKNSVPFENEDLVLSIMWGLLSLLGMSLQLYNSANHSPFPPPSGCSHPHRDRSSHHRHRNLCERQNRHNRHCDRNRRTPRFTPTPSMVVTDNVIDERSPLLYDTRSNINGSQTFDYNRCGHRCGQSPHTNPNSSNVYTGHQYIAGRI